jgi:hypothetical protein
MQKAEKCGEGHERTHAVHQNSFDHALGARATTISTIIHENWTTKTRVQLTNDDRLFLIQLYRWFLSILKVITTVRPETLMRWHRAGFRRYWRWESRSLGGRPQIDVDLRALIRRISMDNPLGVAPRIHGELLKLGFEVAQSSVAKRTVKRRRPPSE